MNEEQLKILLKECSRGDLIYSFEVIKEFEYEDGEVVGGIKIELKDKDIEKCCIVWNSPKVTKEKYLEEKNWYIFQAFGSFFRLLAEKI